MRQGSLLIAFDLLGAECGTEKGGSEVPPPSEWLQWLQLPEQEGRGEVIVQVRSAVGWCRPWYLQVC